jgi:hypothetical protein
MCSGSVMPFCNACLPSVTLGTSTVFFMFILMNIRVQFVYVL